MTTICARKNKLIQNPSELNDQEVYYASNATDKQFYINISDPSLSKRASDPWEHKKKSVEPFQNYADYFEFKIPDIRIRRDYLMATVKELKKPRIDYLKKPKIDYLKKTENRLSERFCI